MTAPRLRRQYRKTRRMLGDSVLFWWRGMEDNKQSTAQNRNKTKQNKARKAHHFSRRWIFLSVQSLFTVVRIGKEWRESLSQQSDVSVFSPCGNIKFPGAFISFRQIRRWKGRRVGREGVEIRGIREKGNGGPGLENAREELNALRIHYVMSQQLKRKLGRKCFPYFTLKELPCCRSTSACQLGLMCLLVISKFRQETNLSPSHSRIYQSSYMTFCWEISWRNQFISLSSNDFKINQEIPFKTYQIRAIFDALLQIFILHTRSDN